MSTVIYGPGDRVTLLLGDDSHVALNIQIQEDYGGIARSLNDTDIADVASLGDERLPLTLIEFDALYPPPG